MNNRRLVSRSRLNQTAFPAPRRQQQHQHQQRASETPARQPARQAELPPYEPPVCALSAEAQQALDGLSNTYDYSKYKMHLQNAKVVIKNVAAESNDRLYSRKEALPRAVARRRKEGVADEDRSEGEAKDETVLREFERSNDTFTAQAEEAMRELIDCSDELSMQNTIMKEVIGEIAPAPAPQQAALRRLRRRDAGSDDEGQEEEGIEPPAADPDNMSAVELLRQLKEDRAAKYASQSKRARYADNNDYKTFKQILHDAQNPNSDTNVDHPSKWFPEENEAGTRSRRRRNNTADNTHNGDDSGSDDDLVIAGSTESLKCPLTLQYFQDPVTNNKCNHTIDRAALMDYHRTEGRVYAGRSQKVAKCPQTGCDAMVAMEDYVKDELMVRKVARAIKRDKAQDNADDDDGDEGPPRGSQRNRPEAIEDDDNDGIIPDADEERDNPRMLGIKRERDRARSRGLSMAPSQPAASMDPDEDVN